MGLADNWCLLGLILFAQFLLIDMWGEFGNLVQVFIVRYCMGGGGGCF